MNKRPGEDDPEADQQGHDRSLDLERQEAGRGLDDVRVDRDEGDDEVQRQRKPFVAPERGDHAGRLLDPARAGHHRDHADDPGRGERQPPDQRRVGRQQGPERHQAGQDEVEGHDEGQPAPAGSWVISLWRNWTTTHQNPSNVNDTADVVA